MDYVIIGTAILFDIFGLIPWVGDFMNPGYSFILWWVYGSKKKNLAMKQFIATPIGMIIEAIPLVNVLPTNLVNAILTIYVFK